MRLEVLGYDVRLWGHGTVTRTVEEYAETLARYIISVAATEDYAKIHLVGHSMGGVIAKGALRKLDGAIEPGRRGRVVLLATPNQGSPVAGFFAGYLGGIIPAVADLADSELSYANSLRGDSGWETGAVWTPYDHLVPESSARMNGARDAVQVDGLHSSILFKKDVANLVSSFIASGKFTGEHGDTGDAGGGKDAILD